MISDQFDKSSNFGTDYDDRKQFCTILSVNIRRGSKSQLNKEVRVLV